MSLRQQRAAITARRADVQAHRARCASQADALAMRARALWPWLWVGGGIVVGVALEEDLDRRPGRPRALSLGGLSALPWGLLIPWIERGLVNADTGSRPRARA